MIHISIRRQPAKESGFYPNTRRRFAKLVCKFGQSTIEESDCPHFWWPKLPRKGLFYSIGVSSFLLCRCCSDRCQHPSRRRPTIIWLHYIFVTRHSHIRVIAWSMAQHMCSLFYAWINVILIGELLWFFFFF